MASNIFQSFSFNADTAYTGAAVEAENCETLSMQLVGAALDKADGTIKIQHSNDGTSWADVAAATTIGAGASVTMLLVTAPCCRYYRPVWAKGANAAGTLVAKMFGKANR
jgi:hypothetical protein